MMCSGRIKNIKLYIWPIFNSVNRTFDTGYPVHVNLLPLCFVRSCNSVYFLVRFPLSDQRTWVARQENSIGADYESLLTTQPSHIWWDYKIYTRYLIVRRAGLLWSQQDFEWRWSVPLFKCLTVLEFSFILFDLCLLITFFNFIMNYVPIVTFWIFTYHKIWILSIMFCSIRDV